MNKNIFLLWLQGWDNAPWLQKQVADSWEINNPDWKINYIDLDNLKDYCDDIDYIYDQSKHIKPQAKSDIIRLSLLKNHGGVWADATLLCMQPLDHWAFEASCVSDFWMYNSCIDKQTDYIGGASWFILSKKLSYIIDLWKTGCDNYWAKRKKMHTFLWMDSIFKDLFFLDSKFKNDWLKTINSTGLDLNSMHGPHILSSDNPYGGWWSHSLNAKDMLINTPPYALKLSGHLNSRFPDPSCLTFKSSNAWHAIKNSKRKFSYKHPWETPKKCI